MGWGLSKAYGGQGYAVEAASTSIDYAFDKVGLDSVTRSSADDNVASQARAERLGSTPGDTVRLPGSLSDVSLCVWSQTKAHWQSKVR